MQTKHTVTAAEYINGQRTSVQPIGEMTRAELDQMIDRLGGAQISNSVWLVPVTPGHTVQYTISQGDPGE